MKTKLGTVIPLLAVIVVGSFASISAAIDADDWEFVGTPLGDARLRDIAVDPVDGNLWYVGSLDNGLYVTRDAGSTWERHLGGNLGTITIDPADPDTVYASAGSTLYRSRNRGATWGFVHAFPDPIPGTPVDSSTFVDSMLVSVTDGTLVVGLASTLHSGRVYTSSDEGATWEISFESVNGFHFWDLAEVPTNGYWFFCTEDPSHTVNPVVMRSRDRGLSWEEMLPLTGIPTAGHGLNLEVHPETETVYFLTESSVLRSSADFGDTWPGTQFLEFGAELLIDPNEPNRFFGGELVRGLKVGGVYYSEDTAESFSFIGLDGHTVGSLALDGSSTKLYAVAFDSGIYVMDLTDDVTCPVTFALGDPDANELVVLRRLRDELMARSRPGRHYRLLLDRHAREIVSIMREHPQLRQRAKDAIVRLMPDVERLLAGKPTSLTFRELWRLRDLLDDFYVRASPALKADIRALRRNVATQQVLERVLAGLR